MATRRDWTFSTLLALVQVITPTLSSAQTSNHPIPFAHSALSHVGYPLLDAFLDSLGTSQSAEDLKTIPQRWDPRIQNVIRPMGRVRLGFHQLRHGQILGTREFFDKALTTFATASTEAPNSPVAWYALGIANLELRRRDYPDPSITQNHMTSYTRYYLGARRAFELSLGADSMFRPTFMTLEALAVQEGDRIQPRWFVDALRRYRSMSPNPDLALALGRQYRIAGDYIGALEEFEDHAALGGDSGMSQLESSRTLAGLGKWDEALRSYWTGARSAGKAGRQMYRSDLVWIVTPEELAKYDRLPADSLEEWLQHLWRARDLENLRPPGSRLREHLRRWALVHRDFRVTLPETRAVFNPQLVTSVGTCATDVLVLDDLEFSNPTRPTDIRSWEPFLDQRAVLYMRHGEPLRRTWSSRARTREGDGNQRALDQNSILTDTTLNRVFETWSYWIDGEPRLFFFSGSQTFGPGPTTLRTEIPSRALLAALQSNSILDGDLAADYRQDIARLQHDLQVREAGLPRALPSHRCSRAYRRWRVWTEEGVETAVQTDGDVLFFPRNLFPRVQVLGMPGPEGSLTGKVLMVFAVPAEDLGQGGPQASGAVTLRFRISGVRVGSRTGFWIDTTRTFRLPPRLESGSLITGLLDIPVMPGDYKVRVAIALADSSLGNAIEVPGTTTTWVPSDSLRLSDIVVGGGTDNLLWNGLEGPVSVKAVAAYQSRDTVELYYVQGGFQPGAVYRTDLVLTETGEEDALLSLSFEEIAAQTFEDKRRGLALGLLRPGTYQLTVTVTETSSARSVRRQRILTVN